MGIDYEYLAASLSSLAGLPVRLYRMKIFCTTDCSGRSGERWR